MKPNPQPWLKKGRVATGEAWPFVEDEPGPFWLFWEVSAPLPSVRPLEPKEEERFCKRREASATFNWSLSVIRIIPGYP